MRKAARSDELRDFARLQVRAGLLGYDAQVGEVADAVAADLGAEDPRVLAAGWLAEAADDLRAEQATWPSVTDHDRLTEAFAALDALGIPVLQGVEDHWVAQAELDQRPDVRGVVWFTQPDVWHAIDEGMLEVNLWHADGANVAEADPLLAEVVAVLDRHGLRARFDEGRIEVAAWWHRRHG